MRLQLVIRSLSSGLIVYVLAAACSAVEVTSAAHDGGPGAESSASGGFTDALVDGVSNPVRDARAQGTPPDVATEPCNKTQAGTSSPYAVHSYPGKSISDLSRLRVVFTQTSSVVVSVDGEQYRSFIAPTVYLRDGAAAVGCPNASDTATFVLP